MARNGINTKTVYIRHCYICWLNFSTRTANNTTQFCYNQITCFDQFIMSQWMQCTEYIYKSIIIPSDRRSETSRRRGPHWGSLQCSPDPTAGFSGMGRKGEGKGGAEMENRGRRRGRTEGWEGDRCHTFWFPDLGSYAPNVCQLQLLFAFYY